VPSMMPRSRRSTMRPTVFVAKLSRSQTRKPESRAPRRRDPVSQYAIQQVRRRWAGIQRLPAARDRDRSRIEHAWRTEPRPRRNRPAITIEYRPGEAFVREERAEVRACKICESNVVTAPPPWMEIGGIAVIAHGVQRMTSDIDVVIQAAPQGRFTRPDVRS
jgi:hypothetical protein